MIHGVVKWVVCFFANSNIFCWAMDTVLFIKFIITITTHHREYSLYGGYYICSAILHPPPPPPFFFLGLLRFFIVSTLIFDRRDVAWRNNDVIIALCSRWVWWVIPQDDQQPMPKARLTALTSKPFNCSSAHPVQRPNSQTIYLPLKICHISTQKTIIRPSHNFAHVTTVERQLSCRAMCKFFVAWFAHYNRS